jgi:hypothetical protein
MFATHVNAYDCKLEWTVTREEAIDDKLGLKRMGELSSQAVSIGAAQTKKKKHSAEFEHQKSPNKKPIEQRIVEKLKNSLHEKVSARISYSEQLLSIAKQKNNSE